MIRFLLPILFMLTSLALPAQAASWGDWLASQEGRRRLLVVAALKDDARRTQQHQWLDDQAGMAERDITLVELTPDAADAPVRLDGKPNFAMKPDDFYAKYQLPPDAFTLLLIGKDGQEAMRSNQPVRARDLFATIDAMPMRQNEMRQKRL